MTMHVMSRLGLGQLMPLRGPNLLSPASGVCGVSLNAAYHLKLDVRPQPTCVCSACYLGLFLGEFGTHMPDSETLTKSLCESQQASWACHECCDQRMSVTPYPCSRIFWKYVGISLLPWPMMKAGRNTGKFYMELHPDYPDP